MNKENNVYYKVLDNDMCSPYQYFQYEMNKTYSTDEELELCESGFHACKNMYEMIIWTDVNPIKDCRFFECILGKTVIEDKDDHKVVSNSITLIKEIPFEEVDKSIKENLNILVHDKDDYVRRSVAELGYCLDILVHDKDWFVRYTVAKQGYGLDILINDTDEDVREAVARQRYGLDIPNKR